MDVRLHDGVRLWVIENVSITSGTDIYLEQLPWAKMIRLRPIHRLLLLLSPHREGHACNNVLSPGWSLVARRQIGLPNFHPGFCGRPPALTSDQELAFDLKAHLWPPHVRKSPSIALPSRTIPGELAGNLPRRLPRFRHAESLLTSSFSYAAAAQTPDSMAPRQSGAKL